MDRSEVIRLAREAGLHVSQEGGVDEVLCCDGYHLQTEEVLELVRLACAAEREACAKTCEQWGANVRVDGWNMAAEDCANAIRARSKECN